MPEGELTLEAHGTDGVLLGWLDDAKTCRREQSCPLSVTQDLRVGARFGKANAFGAGFHLGSDGHDQSVLAELHESGDLILALGYGGTFSFEGASAEWRGLWDILVARLTPAGQPLWHTTLGGTGYELITALAVDPESGDVVIAGRTASKSFDFGDGEVVTLTEEDSSPDHLFLTRYSGETGALRWKKVFSVEPIDGFNGELEALAFGPDGSLFVAGYFPASIHLGDGHTLEARAEAKGELFLTRLSGSTGATEEARAFSGSLGLPHVGGMAVLSDESVVLGGTFIGTLELDEETSLGGAGDADVFVARIAPDGSIEWAARIGGERADYFGGLALGPDDSITFAMKYADDEQDAQVLTESLPHHTFGGGDDVVVARVSVEGQLQWVRSFGGSADDIPYDVHVDAQGNVAVVGMFEQEFTVGSYPLVKNTSRENSATFLVLLDEDGAPRWASAPGGNASSVGRAVRLRDGVVYGFGTFDGPLSMYGNTMLSDGADDIYGFALPVALP